jgi:hypothetical protein
MTLLKSVNLALAFLLELGMLAALSYWGFKTGQSWLGKIGLGLGAPLLAAGVWGVFLSPKAVVTIPQPLKFGLKLGVFGCAVAALATVGQLELAWVFGLLVALNQLLLYLWGSKG